MLWKRKTKNQLLLIWYAALRFIGSLFCLKSALFFQVMSALGSLLFYLSTCRFVLVFIFVRYILSFVRNKFPYSKWKCFGSVSVRVWVFDFLHLNIECGRICSIWNELRLTRCLLLLLLFTFCPLLFPFLDYVSVDANATLYFCCQLYFHSVECVRGHIYVYILMSMPHRCSVWRKTDWIAINVRTWKNPHIRTRTRTRRRNKRMQWIWSSNENGNEIWKTKN